jgi:hypothetical protein
VNENEIRAYIKTFDLFYLVAQSIKCCENLAGAYYIYLDLLNDEAYDRMSDDDYKKYIKSLSQHIAKNNQICPDWISPQISIYRVQCDRPRQTTYEPS